MPALAYAPQPVRTDARPMTRRILELDGLRALAIALVLGCHYEGFARLAHGLPEMGWVGVDVFFALSGYLITSILLGLRGRQTPYKTFYSRRFIRILPPYFAVVLSLLMLGWHGHWLAHNAARNQLLFLQGLSSSTLKPVVAFFTHPSLSYLTPLTLLAGRLPQGVAGLPAKLSNVFGTYWSLSIEEYFYVLWAPIVLRMPRRWIVYTGLAVCLIEPLLRWISNNELSYFGLFFRFDALIYGAFLSLALEQWRHSKAEELVRYLSAAALLAFTGLASILFALRPFAGREVRASGLVLVVGLPFISIAATAVVGLLVLKANTGWWPAKLLRSRPFQVVGTVSYTMYLVHIVAATIVAKLLATLHLAPASLLAACLAAGLTLAWAQLAWRYLENPLLQWKDRRFPNAPPPPYGGVGSTNSLTS